MSKKNQSFNRLKVCGILFMVLMTTPLSAGEVSRIGLVLDKGGKDDHSFNESALKGAQQARERFGFLVKYVEATDDNALVSLLRSLAIKKFDLIIAVGIAQEEALKKVSKQFPDRSFVILDGKVEAPNVKSIVFQEHEGSYLVGAIAAQVSKTKKIGFIGGMDIPLIRRFYLGFQAGAKVIEPQIESQVHFVGVTPDAWNNPAKAKELAMTQYQAQVDVIFAAAGASGLGVFDAAEEMKKFAIGVDSNQNWIKPGLILTSMVKKIDDAVLQTCQEIAQKKFQPGVFYYGLKNGGVDYALDVHNEKLLTPGIRQKIQALKKEIIAGNIRVPDAYQLKP